MRDITPQIHQLDAELVLIGSGRPEHAARFKARHKIDVPLLTDPGRRSYRAAGLERGVGATFNLQSAKSSLRALKKGFRQGWTQGDPWQQGGAFIFTPENDVLFSFISRSSGDHPDPQDLLAALRSARR